MTTVLMSLGNFLMQRELANETGKRYSLLRSLVGFQQSNSWTLTQDSSLPSASNQLIFVTSPAQYQNGSTEGSPTSGYGENQDPEKLQQRFGLPLVTSSEPIVNRLLLSGGTTTFSKSTSSWTMSHDYPSSKTTNHLRTITNGGSTATRFLASSKEEAFSESDLYGSFAPLITQLATVSNLMTQQQSDEGSQQSTLHQNQMDAGAAATNASNQSPTTQNSLLTFHPYPQQQDLRMTPSPTLSQLETLQMELADKAIERDPEAPFLLAQSPTWSPVNPLHPRYEDWEYYMHDEQFT